VQIAPIAHDGVLHENSAPLPRRCADARRSGSCSPPAGKRNFHAEPVMRYCAICTRPALTWPTIRSHRHEMGDVLFGDPTDEVYI